MSLSCSTSVSKYCLVKLINAYLYHVCGSAKIVPMHWLFMVNVTAEPHSHCHITYWLFQCLFYGDCFSYVIVIARHQKVPGKINNSMTPRWECTYIPHRVLPCPLLFPCLFAHSGVQHILCCVFVRLMYPMLPISLNCTFLIEPSVCFNSYLLIE
jgi:hypothetical protein